MHAADVEDDQQWLQPEAGAAHELVVDGRATHRVVAAELVPAPERSDMMAAEVAAQEALAGGDVDADDGAVAVAVVAVVAQFGVVMKRCCIAFVGCIAEVEWGLAPGQQVVVAADMLGGTNDAVVMNAAEEADENGMDGEMNVSHDLEVEVAQAADADTGVHEDLRVGEVEDMMYMASLD